VAKQRNNLSGAVRFGPALTAFSLCLLIAGSALGYVWQKSQNYRLGLQITESENRLKQLARANHTLELQLEELCLPAKLELRARSLGLAPRQPAQVVTLDDVPVAVPENQTGPPQLAARPGGVLTR